MFTGHYNWHSYTWLQLQFVLYLVTGFTHAVASVLNDLFSGVNRVVCRNLRKLPASDELVVIDNTRCVLGTNSLKVTFVSGSWSLLYRRDSLTAARQVRSRLSLIVARSLFNSFSFISQF